MQVTDLINDYKIPKLAAKRLHRMLQTHKSTPKSQLNQASLSASSTTASTAMAAVGTAKRSAPSRTSNRRKVKKPCYVEVSEDSEIELD